MKRRYFLIVFILFFFVAQMPDWKIFRDLDGNRYFFTPHGKIITDSKPLYKYRPVSFNGIEFYYNYGKNLIQNHYYVEGLTILKSILVMPDSYFQVRSVKKKIVRLINKLSKKYDSRFTKYNQAAYFLLYRDSKKITIINEKLQYSISLNGEISILKNKVRENRKYKYNGLKIGVSPFRTKKSKVKKSKFKYILAIDGVRYLANFASIKEVVGFWKGELGYDTFLRKEVYKDDKRVIFSISMKGSRFFKGFEEIVYKDEAAYIIRVFYPSNNKSISREIKSVLLNFKTN